MLLSGGKVIQKECTFDRSKKKYTFKRIGKKVGSFQDLMFKSAKLARGAKYQLEAMSDKRK